MLLSDQSSVVRAHARRDIFEPPSCLYDVNFSTLLCEMKWASLCRVYHKKNVLTKT